MRDHDKSYYLLMLGAILTFFNHQPLIGLLIMENPLYIDTLAPRIVR
jgi:hypothetical protein